jgi:hypothetical protein
MAATGEEGDDMSVICSLCDGCGFVVWENGLPRVPTAEEMAAADECPACDGSGIEPDGSEPL